MTNFSLVPQEMAGGQTRGSQIEATAHTSYSRLKAHPLDAEQSTRVVFLFLHEQPHQIPHCAPIIEALSNAAPDLDIQVIVLRPSQAELLEKLLTKSARKRIQLSSSPAPITARILEAMIGGAAPLSRIGAIRRLRHTLADADMIVAPDTTSMMLKSRFGLKNGPALVYTQHGAGDRAVGFKQSIAGYDFVLVPGAKIKDRMLKEGLVQEGQYAVVGYPKFDNISTSSKDKKSIFNNNLPTVLYNPHFDPQLSSWFTMGEEILDYFLARKDYNLIFAPHVMLWSRRIHVTSNLRHIRWRGNLAHRFKGHPRLHIDTGSDASIDMTYTQAADIYLGDVSSQIYEFISTPRPCVFFNSHNADWKADPNYAHWHLGPVLTSLDSFDEALQHIEAIGETYRGKQRAAFRKTFGDDTAGSAARAANALLQLLEKRAAGVISG